MVGAQQRAYKDEELGELEHQRANHFSYMAFWRMHLFQPDFGHMDERSLYDRSSHDRHGTAFEQEGIEGPRAERPGVNSSLAQLRYIQNSAAKLDDRLKLV